MLRMMKSDPTPQSLPKFREREFGEGGEIMNGYFFGR